MTATTNVRSGPPPLPSGSGVALRHETIDGKYSLIRELGSGSAATVYEAEHVVMGRRAALKLLHRSLTDDDELRDRFVLEARAVSQIHHENVVDIYDMGVTPEGTPYLVMELLHGETLDEIVDRRGALAPAYACELMAQVLAALGAAHAQGIVHRDLKPANIMVTHPRPDAPLVKVLDFGIAKGVLGSHLDGQEGIFGTPLYMAPEQALGRDVDGRADVYAAGIILYQLLAGEPPFEGSTSRILQQVIAGRWKPLASVNPAVPRLLTLAVQRAMATDPDDRIASARDFARQLGPYLSRPPPHSVPGGPLSADAFPLVAHALGGDDFDDPIASRPPRDFPSLHLARVEGKPRGEPIADSMLQSPVFPRAPTAPKIQLSTGRDLENWSDAPLPPSQPAGDSSDFPSEVGTSLLGARRSGDGKDSKSMFPWRRAAWAAAAGIGLGVLVAWLCHFV